MDQYVLDLQELDRTQIALAGGKGAALGELSRLPGVSVPRGFCVTSRAFRRLLAAAPPLEGQIERLSRLTAVEGEEMRALSAAIRGTIKGLSVPAEIAAAIAPALAALGEEAACAVRSSATAEDLPNASFAGQQDSYLNVAGLPGILEHVSRCWASLFTDRAVAYRMRNGFDHASVAMAVVVQRMVLPLAAGIMFTADPVTSNRKVVSVEATFGLGEALASGLATGDVYKVRDAQIAARTIAPKRSALRASPAGGTEQVEIGPPQRERPALTDAQILELARLGRRIDTHLGAPQDIEWCLAEDGFEIVQSRPITTLFPLPAASDAANHVYVSVGHQQMMTDPIRPLGLSFWQLTTRRPMCEAGGRLFVDVSRELASPSTRAGYMEALGRSDPLIGAALQAILDRGDFIETVAEEDDAGEPRRFAAPPVPIEADPAIVAELVERNEASVAALRHEIRALSGLALIDFILADIEELRRLLFEPRSMQVIMAAMSSSWWLNEHLEEWLGQRNAADALARAVPGNVTSEMGLALLDVADAIRPHAAVVDLLEGVTDDRFLDDLPALPGGRAARDAIRGYLDAYGMRCVGEIDITRPRWSERPSTLVPMILGNVRNFEAGARRRHVKRGEREAARSARELLARVRQLPDGEARAAEVAGMIDRVRTFSGYREYPKFAMVSRYSIYRQALLEEAERLARAGVLRESDDVFYLRFEELHNVVRDRWVDHDLVRRRREEYYRNESLSPPRVFTSDGEVIVGSYGRADLPSGALAGLAVSAGTVEGRARVILEVEEAELAAGDILVTTYTDPSWTPLFVAAAGLVTEVGGLMTHGAVIAREYGMPAVVGVERATELIREGQRIRVHGADGYVEILG